jgi:hypothetical protein
MSSHWFNVKDCVPVDGKRVITWDSTSCHITIGRIYRGKWETFMEDGVGLDIEREPAITHWMVLPTPPALHLK